ncbi:MAG: hypothetical protein JNL39_21065 [Opitutaceae bacterium]|nr:hypothetical protein [Opitutaceae bacterium]
MKADLHLPWLLLAVAVVGWYSTVTVWVAIKGAADIRDMVKRLDEEQPKDSAARPDDPAAK